MSRENEFVTLESTLGIQFKKQKLLRLALIHRSYLNEHGEEKENNERLEFLGDAVIELVVTEYLFEHYPEKPEGELTILRSALVKKDHLAEIARRLQLGSYILLSKGEEKSGGREKNYLLANAFEALIGAMYLDAGIKKTAHFIEMQVLSGLDIILTQNLHIDAKSLFQERAQSIAETTPEYKVLEESGPDHNKSFVMGVYLDQDLIAKGQGPSKQQAEQAAARNALQVKKW